MCGVIMSDVPVFSSETHFEINHQLEKSAIFNKVPIRNLCNFEADFTIKRCTNLRFTPLKLRKWSKTALQYFIVFNLPYPFFHVCLVNGGQRRSTLQNVS